MYGNQKGEGNIDNREAYASSDTGEAAATSTPAVVRTLTSATPVAAGVTTSGPAGHAHTATNATTLTAPITTGCNSGAHDAVVVSHDMTENPAESARLRRAKPEARDSRSWQTWPVKHAEGRRRPGQAVALEIALSRQIGQQ